MVLHNIISCRSGLLLLTLLMLITSSNIVYSQSILKTPENKRQIETWLKKGNIPGATVITIGKDNNHEVDNFGYAELKDQKPITPATLFECPSLSCFFTAYAVQHLIDDGQLFLSDHLSKYYKDFDDGDKQAITINDLLMHKSGFSPKLAFYAAPGQIPDALQKTVQNYAGVKLSGKPGVHTMYSKANYDVLGAVIEKVTGMPFERYMSDSIFYPLNLHNTYSGQNVGMKELAAGYKEFFFRPLAYQSPYTRGNIPSTYLVTSAEDVALVLKLILSSQPGDNSLISRTMITKASAAADDEFYTMGMKAKAMHGNDIVESSASNPEYSSFVALNLKEHTAVAVLANSSGPATESIGRSLFDAKDGKLGPEASGIQNEYDKAFSIMSILVSLLALTLLSFIVYSFVQWKRGRVEFQTISSRIAGKLLLVSLSAVPFIIGVYIIPQAFLNMPWKAAFIWMPQSFSLVLYLLAASALLFVTAYGVQIILPHKNIYLRSLPMLIALSLGSGIANSFIIYIVVSGLQSNIGSGYLIYYYALAFMVYIIGRRVVQGKQIRLTLFLLLDMIRNLINKLLNTSYQKYEKVDKGKVVSMLNNDIGTIGAVANLLVGMITGVMTILFAFFLLSFLSFWLTFVSIFVIAAIMGANVWVGIIADKYWKRGLVLKEQFNGMIEGLTNGFKELSLSNEKKSEFRKDIHTLLNEWYEVSVIAHIKHLDVTLFSESIMIIAIGFVALVFPLLFPSYDHTHYMAVVMILLYINGPIASILSSVPYIAQFRAGWNRIKNFLESIPANLTENDLKVIANTRLQGSTIQNIELENVFFHYEGNKFSLGPVNLKASQGELIFIIGGNGSGKTTLAKIISGLYIPDEGSIYINGALTIKSHLSQYFSVVHSDFYLFQKLYLEEADSEVVEAKAARLIEKFGLGEKVVFKNGQYNTINVSAGQKKRLALINSYIEDRPIYLFDEWASDQDPEFRKYFYAELLPELKTAGKIVFVITHDEQYFNYSDRIIKIQGGKLVKDASVATTEILNPELL